MTDENDNGNGNGNGDEDSGGVQAVDTAVRVLSALIDTGAPLMLKTVSERAEMQPPKAHRYLVSFCRTGLAERDPASGGYRLGPLAVRIGLAALRRLNVVQVASPTLGVLRDELGFTAGLAVWGAAGPTFVRFEETNDALIISGRPGSVTQPFIDRELAGVPHPGGTPNPGVAKMSKRDVEALFEGVRRNKLAAIHGDLNPGLHGVSAPLFDHAGAVAGVITVMGSAGLIDTRLDGTVALALSARADEVSRRMGWA